MVKYGIVGMGCMGSLHAENILSGKVKNCILSAVCDTSKERIKSLGSTLPKSVKIYDNYSEMISSGELDVVLIATPHFTHPQLAIEAFLSGLHVLIEKPAGVYTKQVRKMNEVAEKSGRLFGIMYNQRTNPLYATVKRLIDNGELGKILRVNWVVTDWYRTQAYYDSGEWRGTWSGEGGGVLLNQAPHQIDLLQWLCGMPIRIRAFCSYGKYHNIEVEDDVTAYLEYESGATGVFITTTGEYPGTNRLEIAGDRGKVVVEKEKLYFNQLKEPISQHIHTGSKDFTGPECWNCHIPITGENTQHVGILENFTDAVLYETPLLAPGIEGIRGLTISNAMHLSSFTDSWVDLPINEELFYQLIKGKIDESSVSRGL